MMAGQKGKTMKTNIQMLKELNEKYTPAKHGIVSMSEIYLINETLHLDEMDELQLRNLRDTTVLYFGVIMDNQKEYFVMPDKMSAITAVIDQKLFNIGAEV